MTSRHYAITFWTKPENTLPKGVRYAIYGEEICPETKTEHWQSYIELESPMRLAGVKKLYKDNTLHAEARKGTRDEARTYCMKDNKFEEFGSWIKGQGHRTDLENIVNKLKEGSKLSEIMLEQPETYCRYRNGLKDVAAAVTKLNTKAFRKLEVILIAGPTGNGKTKLAMEEAEYRIQGDQLNWWQDYDGEKIICIDEYDNDLKITGLLNLLDGYQLRLNVKGSHTYANWNKVYITTNLTVDQLHANAKPAHRAALFRRITTIDNQWPDDVDLDDI